MLTQAPIVLNNSNILARSAKLFLWELLTAPGSLLLTRRDQNVKTAYILTAGERTASGWDVIGHHKGFSLHIFPSYQPRLSHNTLHVAPMYGVILERENKTHSISPSLVFNLILDDTKAYRRHTRMPYFIALLQIHSEGSIEKPGGR